MKNRSHQGDGHRKPQLRFVNIVNCGQNPWSGMF